MTPVCPDPWFVPIARQWALAFIERVALDPSFCADEKEMTNWCANLLMRGHMEAQRQLLDGRKDEPA